MSKNYSNKEEYDKLKGIKKEIRDKEIIRKNAPTQSDYNKLYSLLRDFGMNIRRADIPQFNNVKEMEIWKTKKINTYLDNYKEHTNETAVNPNISTYKPNSFFTKKEKTETIDWSKFHF